MTKIHLKNVRLSFPNLYSKEPAFKKTWETMSEEEKAKAKYTATFLLSKEDVKTKKLIDDALEEARTKAKFKKLPEGDFLCVKDGDDKEYDGYQGHWTIKAGNKKRPTLIDRDRSVLTSEDDKFYPGCYVNAIIDFYPYNFASPGINANLYGVQFSKDGENFSADSTASADEFEDLEGEL